MLHLAYCKRNFIKCETCNEFYDKNEKTEHLETHKKPC